MEVRKNCMQTNTKELQMIGIIKPAVHLHHFWFWIKKIEVLDFCCTDCKILLRTRETCGKDNLRRKNGHSNCLYFCRRN
jgi:hypothetical protein